ncbi:hypothetical protein DL93DRAFT_1171032 [Clavulina sp. PMI_390]|nr:hypothetical protein DL93DRAFT_1171032 [Clavulina sp. PMI_390]
MDSPAGLLARGQKRRLSEMIDADVGDPPRVVTPRRSEVLSPTVTHGVMAMSIGGDAAAGEVEQASLPSVTPSAQPLPIPPTTTAIKQLSAKVSISTAVPGRSEPPIMLRIPRRVKPSDPASASQSTPSSHNISSNPPSSISTPSSTVAGSSLEIKDSLVPLLDDDDDDDIPLSIVVSNERPPPPQSESPAKDDTNGSNTIIPPSLQQPTGEDHPAKLSSQDGGETMQGKDQPVDTPSDPFMSERPSPPGVSPVSSDNVEQAS